jgi:hypothetical protein
MKTGIGEGWATKWMSSFALKSKMSAGYSIVEAMIFLAISTAMFTLLAVQINGMQNRSDFAQTARDFSSRLSDLANDVSTGRYNNSASFTCVANTSSPVILSDAALGGISDGCILVGQVLAMSAGSNSYDIFPLAGRQSINDLGTVRDVQSLTEASPIAVSLASSNESIGHGLVIKKVTYNIGAGELPAFGAAFITTFGNQGSSGLSSGEISVNLLPLVSADLATSLSSATSIFSSSGGVAVTICLQDGPSPTRHAVVVIGGKGRQLSNKLEIFDDTAACP